MPHVLKRECYFLAVVAVVLFIIGAQISLPNKWNKLISFQQRPRFWENFSDSGNKSFKSRSTLSESYVTDMSGLNEQSYNSEIKGFEINAVDNGVYSNNIDDRKDWGQIEASESSELDTLTNLLVEKLRFAELKYFSFKPTCENKAKIANSCDQKCLRPELPDNPKERISQLIESQNLKMTSEQHKLLRQIANEVKVNYDIILLTAASSNHYLESQALLKNLHERVYPYLKNFTLIYFDLGLSEHEKNMTQKYCRCQVLSFPFGKFSEYVQNLKCYAWKPVIIKAIIQKANLVIWMDASIRFRNDSKNLKIIIQRSRERGMQIGGTATFSTFRTDRSMYHFFGDEPCAYLALGQSKATFGFYKNELFVVRAILEPWVACALNKQCMCSSPEPGGCYASKQMAAKYERGQGSIVYGMCHRFDQSALSLIIHKLYQEKYKWIMIGNNDFLKIQRDNKLSYFS